MKKIRKSLTSHQVVSMGEYEELMDQLTFFLKTKKLQEELLDVNGMILTWIFHYCEKNNIPIHDDENIYYLIKRSRELLAKITPINRHLTGEKNYRRPNSSLTQ